MTKFIIDIILLLVLISFSLPVLSNEIESSYQINSDDKYRVTRTDKIEMWEQPKRKGTPANLVSEQHMRFSGYNESDNSFQSYTVPIADYDTYITESFQKDGETFVRDNLGRVFKTGNRGLTNEQLKTLDTVHTNTQAIQQNRQDIGALNSRLDTTNRRIDDVHEQLEAGLATVTALTSLHPNPKATGRTQLAIGSGMYRDNVAGAVGLFHHINDNTMLSAGVAYGGSSEWAGNIGLTFSFGSNKNKKR